MDSNLDKDAGRCKPLPKVPTRIDGLDGLLDGGFPAGRLTVVCGGPGTGKSMLGLEFLYRSALAGAPGVFAAFEESADDIRRNGLTMGWDLEALESRGMLAVLEAPVQGRSMVTGDYDMQGLLSIIEGQASDIGAELAVLDALDVPLSLFEQSRRRQAELQFFKDWLRKRNITAVLTVKTERMGWITSESRHLDFLADCVIELDRRMASQAPQRRLRVVKYRGSGFHGNDTPFVINRDGLGVMPISIHSLDHTASQKMFSIGHPRLDEELGGGLRQGSSVLIGGVTGAGKTALACNFIDKAARRGEDVLYAGFEESADAVAANMKSLGLDLARAVDQGRLHFFNALPESRAAEEHLWEIIHEMEQRRPAHLVVDAISACLRMGDERDAFDFLIRLVQACKEKQITCLLLNQTDSMTELQDITGVGISSLIDTVIFLGMVAGEGEINRNLVVLKSRGASHSNRFSEYRITDHGIVIDDIYIGPDGVLLGSARERRQEWEAQELLRLRKLIVNKQMEINRRRASQEVEAARIETDIETLEAELAELCGLTRLYDRRNEGDTLSRPEGETSTGCGREEGEPYE